MPEKEGKIELRPYHIRDFALDCGRYTCIAQDLPGAEERFGKEFVGRLKQFYDKLRAMKTGTISVVGGLDDICGFCTTLNSCCNKYLNLDADAKDLMSELGLQIGTRIPIKEFLERVWKCSIVDRIVEMPPTDSAR